MVVLSMLFLVMMTLLMLHLILVLLLLNFWSYCYYYINLSWTFLFYWFLGLCLSLLSFLAFLGGCGNGLILVPRFLLFPLKKCCVRMLLRSPLEIDYHLRRCLIILFLAILHYIVLLLLLLYILLFCCAFGTLGDRLSLLLFVSGVDLVVVNGWLFLPQSFFLFHFVLIWRHSRCLLLSCLTSPEVRKGIAFVFVHKIRCFFFAFLFFSFYRCWSLSTLLRSL